MSVALDYKKGSPFSNVVEKVEVVYDFANDGGAVSVIDLFEAKEALVLHRAVVKIKTAFTSGGSATLEIGVKAGDTDAILPATAVASLTAPKVYNGDAAGTGIYLAAGAILSAEIKVAAMTAGKLHLVVEVSKF